MGHKSSEAGSDSEYSERRRRTKTRRDKKNSNRIIPDGGLQFDDPRNRNSNRIIPEEGEVEMDYPRNKKNSVENNSDDYSGAKAEKAAQGKQPENSDDTDAQKPPVRTAKLLMDLCCDGCTKRISRTVTKFAGCDLVSIDQQAKTLTVKGTTNMISALADLLEMKFNKSVEITPAEGGSGEEKDMVVRGDDGATKAAGKELDGNKSNKPPVTTAELKMAVPCVCDGHLLQIRKIVENTKGFHSCKVSSDEMGKAVVSVTGTMDVINAVKEKLEKELKTRSASVLFTGTATTVNIPFSYYVDYAPFRRRF
ncbi:heavy metal-associated isoprenylated plant protein 3-like isoform X2 [Diospyros lotus]|uniref:heavy metal-associated isoprenylated plant protein 3-like isoform X2 n=1 Tax=Diospyros lotus TaxID=55363 RepID=UPI002255768E|nr:heavy metal-associated isoprenylated plant protein 3-like isoform X2 [Diospyros lotus]